MWFFCFSPCCVLSFSIIPYVSLIILNLFNIHLLFYLLLSQTLERDFRCLGYLMTLPHGGLFPCVFGNCCTIAHLSGALYVGILISLVEGRSLQCPERICNSFPWVPAKASLHYPDTNVYIKSLAPRF